MLTSIIDLLKRIAFTYQSEWLHEINSCWNLDKISSNNVHLNFGSLNYLSLVRHSQSCAKIAGALLAAQQPGCEQLQNWAGIIDIAFLPPHTTESQSKIYNLIAHS